MKTHTIQSCEYVEIKCPDCGKIKRTKISNLAHRGFRCSCNRKTSYPNKFVYAVLDQLGIEYEGKSVREIFSRLINVIAPSSETKEDIVAREASQAALSNVYEYVEENSMDLSCVDHMPIEVMDISMKAFLTEYILGSVTKDLECRVEKYME